MLKKYLNDNILLHNIFLKHQVFNFLKFYFILATDWEEVQDCSIIYSLQGIVFYFVSLENYIFYDILS